MVLCGRPSNVVLRGPAGVCDPSCNPLDDNDFDGSGTMHTKIGTACTTDPTEGCYGSPSTTHTTFFTCAHPATGQALEHDVAGHVEIDGEIERQPVEDPVQLDRLVPVPGEPVEHEAPLERAAVGGEALLDEADGDIVGDQLASIHVVLGLEPEPGAGVRGARLRRRCRLAQSEGWCACGERQKKSSRT